MFVFTIISILSSVFLYKIDFHNIVCNICDRKYKKWKKITNLVRSTHDSQISIYTISVKMILQALYLSFIQYINNSVRKLDKNIYEVSYIIGGRNYKMITIPKKGPLPFLHIRDENNNDVTEFIIPYYGPNYDWHSISVIPQFFKYKRLIFDMEDGSQKIFEELDYINF